jgi:hypothetical protein
MLVNQVQIFSKNAVKKIYGKKLYDFKTTNEGNFSHEKKWCRQMLARHVLYSYLRLGEDKECPYLETKKSLQRQEA